VVSRWNVENGCREDTDISAVAESEGKGEVSGRAFTFRRVMHNSDRTKLKYSEIDIEARGLIELLKKVIGDSYPGQSWEGETVNMIGPFMPIVHYWEELVEAGKEKKGDGYKHKEAREDLMKLLDHVKSSTELETYFKTRESHIQSNSTTYQTMWTLFRPGGKVVAKPFMNTPQVFIVKASPEPLENNNLSVGCWCYDWDGKDMVKSSFNFPIEKFRGTKDICSLFCYPLQYHRDEAGRFCYEDLCRTLQAQGQIFNDLCRVERGAKQMFQYDGIALSSIGRVKKTPVRDEVRHALPHKAHWLMFYVQPG
jgi:hypothetical protein